MSFHRRIFWFPKAIEKAESYEDAFAPGPDGTSAVADGVSSAIYSRQWAQRLTKKAVESPPDEWSPQGLTPWLEPLREAWRAEIETL